MTPDQIATKGDIAALQDGLRKLQDMVAALSPPPDRMSLEAAANYCGVTVPTVREWIRSGEIEAQGTARKRTVARADLDKRKKR